MTYTGTLASERSAPRKRDAEATRAAILAAAKHQFAKCGFDGAYLRDIASEAGVDAALINRYFGGKEGLFQAALKDSMFPSVAHWDRKTFGYELAKLMAGHAHQNLERTHAFAFLLQAATNPTTAPMLNVAVQKRFMGPIREWIGGPHAAARARVMASVIIGLLVERLIRDEALKGEERDVFIERAATVLQSLVAS
ncbi:MAG: TetR family transcriptional regulator [Alphaproteobacteria bacterium]|nr:TetR family transcriptional regulator [Alphaproteobacteria bacterium]